MKNKCHLTLVKMRAQLEMELGEAVAEDDIDEIAVDRLARALEQVLDQIPRNDETILGLGCRATVAEAKGKWVLAARYRRSQIDRMLASTGDSGLTSVERALLMEVDPLEVDDSADIYSLSEVADEWRMLVIDLWQACDYHRANAELSSLEAFAAASKLDMPDLQEWKRVLREDAGDDTES